MDRSGYGGAEHISNELIRREGKLKNRISANMIIDNKTVGESITVKKKWIDGNYQYPSY